MIQHIKLYNNKHQTIKQTKQIPFNLILINIQIPNINNIQTYKLIHQLPHQQQTPIITITTHTITKQKKKLLNTKINNYLTKPIKKKQLHNLLLHYKPDNNISSHIITPKINKIIINPNTTLN